MRLNQSYDSLESSYAGKFINRRARKLDPKICVVNKPQVKYNFLSSLKTNELRHLFLVGLSGCVTIAYARTKWTTLSTLAPVFYLFTFMFYVFFYFLWYFIHIFVIPLKFNPYSCGHILVQHETTYLFYIVSEYV